MDTNKLIDNTFNAFMVLYFRYGYSYEEALEKTEKRLKEVLLPEVAEGKSEAIKKEIGILKSVKETEQK